MCVGGEGRGVGHVMFLAGCLPDHLFYIDATMWWMQNCPMLQLLWKGE